MSRISGKINLMQMKATLMNIKGKLGPVECVVIPIENNKLFKGEKGVYLDLIAFDIDLAKRHKDSKDTHLIKQSFDKETREKMTEDELKSLPIIGNLQVWGAVEESAPVSDMTVKSEDDLPF